MEALKLICEWCGLHFERKTSRSNAPRFCGKKCSAIWRMKQPSMRAKYEEIWNDPARRQRARKRLTKLRSDPAFQAKLGEYNNSNRNPFKGPRAAEIRALAVQSNAASGWKGINGKNKGGNGHGPTVPQRALWAALGSGWLMEHPVPMANCRVRKVPTCYKIDLAHLASKTAVEVDGETHRSATAQKRDAKKEQALAELGWTTVRVSNSEVLRDLSSTLKRILATTSLAGC